MTISNSENLTPARTPVGLPLPKRAELLREHVETHAAAAGAQYRLPAPLLAVLHDQGVLRALLPREYGYEQADFLEFMTLVGELAKVDGSIAWCVNQAAIFATNVSRLPAAGAKVLLADPQLIVAHGPPTHAVAKKVAGGHRVTGRWSFGSGVHHASWLAGVAREEDAPKGTPPSTYLFPVADATIESGWNSSGLRGTGSDEFWVQDVFVSDDLSYPLTAPNQFADPFYDLPSVLLFGCGFGAVMLGVARGMLDSVLALVRDKRNKTTFTRLAADPHSHEQIGVAEAQWRAAHHYLFGEVRAVLSELQQAGKVDYDQRVRLRLAGTHALRQARIVADIAWNLCGTSGIATDSVLHRRYQDCLVGCQHMQARTSMYPLVGRYFLGVDDNLGPLV